MMVKKSPIELIRNASLDEIAYIFRELAGNRAKIISIDFDPRNIHVHVPVMSIEQFNVQFEFIPYWWRPIIHIHIKHDSLHIHVALTTLSKAQHIPVATRIQMDRNKINTHM